MWGDVDLIVTLRHRGMSHTVRYCDLSFSETAELQTYWHDRGVRDIQTTREEGMDKHDYRGCQ